MKPSLQVRLSQHLALTPQLQQSIRLLQLSTLELHQEVEQMLEQNPFLDTEDERRHGLDGPPAERSKATEREESAEAKTGGDAEAAPIDRGGPASSAPPSARTGRTAPSATTSTASRELPSAAAGRPGRQTTTPSRERSGTAPAWPTTCAARLLGMRLSPEDAAALRC
jgi:RNA polymerase sigma-54 factor